MRRYNHDLSFTHSLSADMGLLIPIAAVDVLPGDSFIHSLNLLARVAPLAKPVMSKVDIRVHHWYVPNRLLWENWEEFIVGNVASHTYPQLTPASAGETVLYDHMGVEPVTGVAFDALPVRAYNKIFNEFYRDQDLITARGEDDLDLARVAWGKDYFTTARAVPQQGSAVEVGFSAGQAPVEGFGLTGTLAGTGSAAWRETDSANDVTEDRVLPSSTANLGMKYSGTGASARPDIYADLSNATGGIDINDLRQAIALQRIAEARSRFGSRYIDFLRFYGVNPKDGRLDRPEYLGGGRQSISFSEVLATAEGTSTEVGDLFGHGIAGLNSRPYRKMFDEHGWMISCLSIRPEALYQNGIPRRFSRTSPDDFCHRELEELPWQSIPQTELFGAGDAATVFGYTPKYDEYREMPNYVSGTFRQGTEEDWTLAREFSSAPTLNASFIECTPSDRIYQDTNQPEMLLTINNRIKARRLVRSSAKGSNVTL